MKEIKNKNKNKMKISNLETLVGLLEETENDNNNNVNKHFINRDQHLLDISSSLHSDIRVLLLKLDHGLSELQSYAETLKEAEKDISQKEEINNIDFDLSEWELTRYSINKKEEDTIFYGINNIEKSFIEYIDEIIEILEGNYESLNIDDIDKENFILNFKDFKELAEKLGFVEYFDFEAEEKIINKCSEEIGNCNQRLSELELEINALDDEEEEDYSYKREELEQEQSQLESDIDGHAYDADGEFSEIMSKVSVVHEQLSTLYNKADGLFMDLDSLVEDLINENIFKEPKEFKAKENLILENINEKEVKLRLTIPGNNKHSGDWIIFNDSSVYYKSHETNHEYKVLKHNIGSFNKEIEKMVKSFISYKCRKHPSISESLSNMILKERKLEIGLDLLNEIVTHKKVLHKHGFNLNNNSYGKIEKTYDKIQEVLLEEKAETKVKRLFDGKYRVLILDENENINKDIIKCGLKMIELGINKNEFNENIGKKLDYYLNLKEEKSIQKKSLKDDFVKYLNSFKGWNKNAYLQKLKDVPTSEIKYVGDNQIIVKIDSFVDCKKIGSPSWCIARGNGMWNNYRKDGEFFIKFDFNQEASSNSSMIGFHLNENAEIKYAHLKNDKSLSSAEKTVLIKELKSKGLRYFKHSFVMMQDDDFNKYIQEFMNKNPNYSDGGVLEIKNNHSLKNINGFWDSIILKNCSVENITCGIPGDFTESRLEIINNKKELNITGIYSEIAISNVNFLSLENIRVLKLDIKNVNKASIKGENEIIVLESDSSNIEEITSKHKMMTIVLNNTNVKNIENISSERWHVDCFDKNISLENSKIIKIKNLDSIKDLNLTEDIELDIFIESLKGGEIENIKSPKTKIEILNPKNITKCNSNKLKKLDLKGVTPLKEVTKNTIEDFNFDIDIVNGEEPIFRRNRIRKITTTNSEYLKSLKGTGAESLKCRKF